MKANHYLDEAIRVSLIADPDITAQQHTEIARISQMVALQVKYIEHLRERLAAPSKQGEEPR